MTLAISQKNHTSASPRGNILVISGPSGAGKGTLIAAALKVLPNLVLSVSATTRPPRPGEVADVTYHFKTDEEFDELVRNGGLLEWAEVHGHRYGTLTDEVNSALDAGVDLILEIDLQGYLQVKSQISDVFSIFIAPPSFEELRKRLVLRGTEDEDSLSRRLRTARVEMEAQDRYTVTIVNDDLEIATAELIETIQQLRNRQTGQPD